MYLFVLWLHEYSWFWGKSGPSYANKLAQLDLGCSFYINKQKLFYFTYGMAKNNADIPSNNVRAINNGMYFLIARVPIFFKLSNTKTTGSW